MKYDKLIVVTMQAAEDILAEKFGGKAAKKVSELVKQNYTTELNSGLEKLGEESTKVLITTAFLQALLQTDEVDLKFVEYYKDKINNKEIEIGITRDSSQQPWHPYQKITLNKNSYEIDLYKKYDSVLKQQEEEQELELNKKIDSLK